MHLPHRVLCLVRRNLSPINFCGEPGFSEISTLSPKSLLLRRKPSLRCGTHINRSKREGYRDGSEARGALVTPLLRKTLHKAAVESMKRYYLHGKNARPFISPKYLQDYSNERARLGFQPRSHRRCLYWHRGRIAAPLPKKRRNKKNVVHQ